MMLIDPSGLTPPSASPSFATRIEVPSGVKVSMSGSAPTVTCIGAAARFDVSYSSTDPSSVVVAAGVAAASIPSRTATLVTPSNIWVSMAMVVTRLPSVMSKTSIPGPPAT